MIDKNDGLGGSYTLNPKTGKRTLVARTEPPKPATAQNDQPASAGIFSPAEPADTSAKE